MKRINLILVVIAMGVTAHAGELPLVEAIDPRKPSQDFEGTVTTQSGEKCRVHMRTYGSEQIAMAREFGRRLSGRTYSDLNGMLLYKGMQLYKDQFFAKCFAQFALEAYHQTQP